MLIQNIAATLQTIMFLLNLQS